MTAYIKMIDIWMIFSMFYPFLVVSLYSIMEVLKNKKNNVKTAPGEWREALDSMNSKTVLFFALGLVNSASSSVKNIC